jgi:hypothetical protein
MTLDWASATPDIIVRATNADSSPRIKIFIVSSTFLLRRTINEPAGYEKPAASPVQAVLRGLAFPGS